MDSSGYSGYPSPYPNNTFPYSYDPRRQRAFTTTSYVPPYPPPPGVSPPPMSMPIPSILTPGAQPYLPMLQTDLFFQRQGPNMSVTRPPPPPPPTSSAPAIPPLPYAIRHTNSSPPFVSSPGTDKLHRSVTAPPPIPPRPIHRHASQPTRPPKVPLHFPAAEIRTPVKVSPTSAQIPPVPISSPQVPPIEVRSVLVAPVQEPPTQVPFTQVPSAQMPMPSIEVSSMQMPSTQMPSTEVSSTQVPSTPAQEMQPRPPIPEEDELAIVLAISASDSAQRQELKTQEEEELERALEESRLIAESEKNFYKFAYPQDSHQEMSNAEAGPSSYSDESRGRQASRTRPQSHEDATSPHNDTDDWPSFPPTISVTQSFDDESYSDLTSKKNDGNFKPLEELSPADEESDLPSYTEAISDAAINASDQSFDVQPKPPVDDTSLSPLQMPQPTLLRSSRSSGSLSSNRLLQGESPSPPSASASTSTRTPSIPRPRTADGVRPNEAPSRALLEVTIPQSPQSTDNEPRTASPSVFSPSQFVDPEYLQGVSIGFTPPLISAALTPFQGVIPNIVALPYGRCPPLHFQATSWRHLRILMARLSKTRIEATLEAIAAEKNELKLRTVVQFVKVANSESDWRTIIWLSIDHPVPTSAVSWKYTNGDVNTLPWSYTLSPLPALLSEGADVPTSKYYTIPSTASKPYPKLPISFPDMAMYLHAALEESRRAMHDSSSGMRRLAKLIDLCYPEVVYDDGDHSPERRSVSGLFKRVIGRGSRSKKDGRRGNEETYDMVTPFVLDE